MISVIIPTHNRPEELRTAIDSIFSQTILPKELIIVDDASEPPLSEDIFNYNSLGIECVLIRNEMSKGGNFARNLGISSAKSEYIAFLDDDDFFENNKIEVIISYINMYPNIDLFYHRARINMKREGYNYITKPSSYLSNINSLLQKNVIGGTPMVVAKRTSLTAVGGFDIQLPALQDYELWLRLYVNNCKFKFIDRLLTQCNYLTNYKSVSKSLEANKLAIQIIENRYSDLYSKLNFWQKRQYEYNKYKLIVHKMLLNGNYKEAFYYSFKYSIQNLYFLSLLHAIVILFGPRLISILKKGGI